MVDVILVMMLLVAGLSLEKGDAETAGRAMRESTAAASADAAAGRADSTPCATVSPRFRDLGSHDAVVNPNGRQDQGHPDGI
ncbi:hypothetical protein [uncultured Haliea sp.]|uniref:hypothetical protein n=1 Tax=uncultured Haliea sp. TaxID=622616 RepID=UPI0030D7188C|tara:strand:- start:572 stop:817 length:246 start_codon:yes stop_codon:yes gene_type:complete